MCSPSPSGPEVGVPPESDGGSTDGGGGAGRLQWLKLSARWRSRHCEHPSPRQPGDPNSLNMFPLPLRE